MATVFQIPITNGNPTGGSGTVSTLDNLATVLANLPVFPRDSGGGDATDPVNHALKVNVVAGAGSGGTSSNFGSAFPTPGTAVGFSDGTNMVAARIKAASTAAVAADPAIVVAMSPNNYDFGAGTGGSKTQRVLLDSSQADPGNYETVAASQTDQVMGGTGAVGDFLSSLLIVPASTSPGAVSIKDGAGSAITVFAGGASSVSNLAPIFIPLGYTSTGGAWKITTGASVSAIGAGKFT